MDAADQMLDGVVEQARLQAKSCPTIECVRTAAKRYHEQTEVYRKYLACWGRVAKAFEAEAFRRAKAGES